MNSNDLVQNIFVAGHSGMVGSAIVRHLKKLNYQNILTASRDELDLTNQNAVNAFFQKNKIDQVYLAAAKVGGIQSNNTCPAEFIYQNLMIQTNVIHAAHLSNVQKLLFLGSSCIYPKLATQPIKEDALMTGPLEPTNESYAIAKIAGIKICESYNRQYGRDYRSIMPANLYGPFDNYHSDNSHVIPALLLRFYQAIKNKDDEVVIWGSGKPMREFLYIDDLAEASVFVMNLSFDTYQKNTGLMFSHINIGFGIDYTIRELAEKIASLTGFQGRLIFNKNKPDGAPKKIMNVSKIKSLGWKPKTSLEEGLKLTYDWFLNNKVN